MGLHVLQPQRAERGLVPERRVTVGVAAVQQAHEGAVGNGAESNEEDTELTFGGSNVYW